MPFTGLGTPGAMIRKLRERVDLARETYGAVREAAQGRASTGLAALRAAAEKDRSQEGDSQAQQQGDIRERPFRTVGREAGEETSGHETSAHWRESARDRLGAILDRSKLVEVEHDSELKRHSENARPVHEKTSAASATREKGDRCEGGKVGASLCHALIFIELSPFNRSRATVVIHIGALHSKTCTVPFRLKHSTLGKLITEGNICEANHANRL